MLNAETYGWELGDGEVQDGDKSKAYYLCSNDIEFNDAVYGYDLAGNLVYTFMQGAEEQ